MKIALFGLFTIGPVDEFMDMVDLSDHGKKKYCTSFFAELSDKEVEKTKLPDETNENFLDRLCNAVIKGVKGQPILLLAADDIENCSLWMASGVQSISNGKKCARFVDVLKWMGLDPEYGKCMIPTKLNGSISFDSIKTVANEFRRLGY